MKNKSEPTPRELISNYFEQQGRTVTGLAATLGYALTELKASATSAQAEAQTEGPSEADEGAADSKVPEVYKFCLAEAFPATSKYGLKLLDVQVGDEARLLAMLALLGTSARASDVTQWAQANKAKLLSSIAGIGTHSSKFAKTNTNLVLFHKPLQTEAMPFLSSANVPEGISLSYFGNAATMPVARVLYAQFSYGGQRYSLYEALMDDNRGFLENCGLPRDVVTELQAVQNTPTELPDRVAQVRWPTEDGQYVTLSPLPSVAVLDAIAAAHRYNPDKEAMQGRYLPQFPMRIGGAKPQNGGALNSALKGEHPLFRAQVNPLKKDSGSLVLRRLWSGYPFNRLSNDLVEKLSSDLSHLNSEAKDNWVASVLKPVAYQSLGFLLQAKAAFEQELVEVEPALAERLKRSKATAWLLDTNKETLEGLADAFASHVFRQAPKLQSSEDLRPRVMAHVAETVAHVIAKEPQ